MTTWSSLLAWRIAGRSMRTTPSSPSTEPGRNGDSTPITAMSITVWAINHPEIVTSKASISFLKGLEGNRRPEGVETVEGNQSTTPSSSSPRTRLTRWPCSVFGNWVWIFPKHVMEGVAPAGLRQTRVLAEPDGRFGSVQVRALRDDQFVKQGATTTTTNGKRTWTR